MEITLREFTVKKELWGKGEGKYKVSASFTHGKNFFTIDLGQELGEEIVNHCKGKIAESSQEALEQLTIMAKG